MDFEKFNDIRPYKDDEIQAAMHRIAESPHISNIASYLYPGIDVNMFKQLLMSCSTVDDFQKKVMRNVVQKIVSGTMKNLTHSGIENFKEGRRYLLISNHRDIVLDSAVIQFLLNENGVPTTESAVGDNLITSPFIEDVIRSNKMIKVIRSTSPRELYMVSKTLSEYIRTNISQSNSSVWIAQRNGRTKDGLDMTEQGLLKMFDMSGKGDFANDFAELNIMPTSISYEYEPCDILKAVELFIKKRQKYIKGKDEDLNSIITGIMQFKGNVHFSFNEPLTADEIGSAAELDSNERFKALAGIIDKKINSNYKLWKTNYMAYDILNSTNEFANMYSSAEKDEFLNYISFKMQSVEEGIEEVEQILLSIYANPVVTRKNMNL